jgi:hydrogenase maturation protease
MQARRGSSDIVVVAAVGNPLRGDDAAGWRVAETIEHHWGARGIRVLVGQQVLPEWAAVLAEADLVYFVDAAVGRERVALEPLQPAVGDDAPAVTHALEPATILRMALDLFGRAPEAYRLTIPATDFDFAEHLSAQTQAGVDAAVRLLDQALASTRQRCGGTPGY